MKRICVFVLWNLMGFCWILHSQEVISSPSVFPTATGTESCDTILLRTLWDNYSFTGQDPTKDPVFVNKLRILAKGITPKTMSYVCRSVDSLLHKASADSTSFTRITDMLNYLFNDFSSPVRNGTIGLHLLQSLSNSPYLESSVREQYAFKYRQASLDAIGSKAANFSFVMPSGEVTSLYEQKASYLLLYFYNPGCEACEQTSSLLKSNSLINRLLDSGKLKILALYPDRENTVWKAYTRTTPRWIHGWDEQDLIRKNNLYSLEAIPSMYLLDASKKVVLRDANLEELAAQLQMINP
jgi:hypothetical protein